MFYLDTSSGGARVASLTTFRPFQVPALRSVRLQLVVFAENDSRLVGPAPFPSVVSTFDLRLGLRI